MSHFNYNAVARVSDPSLDMLSHLPRESQSDEITKAVDKTGSPNSFFNA